MVYNEFHGVADFVVMGRDISGPVTYAPTYVLADDPLQSARRELARMVGAQWRREAGLRGLLDPVPLGVRWSTAWGDPYGDHPHLAPGGSREASADLTSFTEDFLALPRQRLMVLGGPGAGKSAFCVLLVLSLLARRRPEDPVPVLTTLTSWDPATQDFEVWLTRRLAEDYPRLHHPRGGGANAAARLVEAQAVLPVLDGLDEISPPRRRLALRGLNRALAGDCPIVLTCRTSAYAALLEEADVLRSATVIRALPVTALTALDYLITAVPPQRQEPGSQYSRPWQTTRTDRSPRHCRHR
ncbi:NACHT domain-containing protein [Streptomyces javensis]|uniref:NACHT domain-containing protein n=1 Tax=Streptomyces javensis TaxID=114698 RepID=A0ABS0RAC6_9ACTN|nr:NACHT domain-containing protein [Streptomyces javensis]MBI0314357.1 NACHT domain-containing protein [Streptomyces javensis]